MLIQLDDFLGLLTNKCEEVQELNISLNNERTSLSITIFELFCKKLSSCKNLQTLDINGNFSNGDINLQNLCKTLLQCTNLQDINFIDVAVQSEKTKEALLLAKNLLTKNLSVICSSNTNEGRFQVVDKVTPIQLKLENLEIKTNKRQFSLPLIPSENLLFKLVDKYLYFCNRISKETREAKYSVLTPEIEKRLNLSKSKRESLLPIICLIVSLLEGSDLILKKLTKTVNWPYFELLDYITIQECLEEFIQRKQQEKERYFGDDLSDDSDSDDDKAFNAYLLGSKKVVTAKTLDHMSTLSKQTDLFWVRTKRDTPQHVGLKKKIVSIADKITKKVPLDLALRSLKKDIVDKTLNSALEKRGEIVYSDKEQMATALGLIESINSIISEPKQLEELLSRSKPIFVLGTRGVNYMLDRWNADARRYHRGINERQYPQFSEAVLKTLPYDYYTELDQEHDFHHNIAEELAVQQEALRLNQFLYSLHNTPPCIALSGNHTIGNYLFNSVGDCLQDHFSNGVDKHLDDLAEKRKEYPDYWGKHLKNSFNPSIAIGSRPYHALKYAFSLKDYYSNSMSPRYWNDGTIEYSHAGKVYLSLHPLQEILAKNGPNNLSMQDRQARVSIGDQIAPEKELSFLGFMPGDRIFHQFIVKFPSFNKQWKNIYGVKYGLDKETYEAFKCLIEATLPESIERSQVINLLSEWLCAYHEVLLIEVAKEEALRQGGILVYINRDGKLALEPENGRIFTRGVGNSSLRNEIHTSRELHLELAKHITEKDDKSIPGFVLTNFNHVKGVLEKSLKEEGFLHRISSKTTLTTEQDGLSFSKQTSSKEIKEKDGKQAGNSFLLQYANYSKSSSVSSAILMAHLEDATHLYTDLEINTLLQKNLNSFPNVDIYAPQHPLVQGEFGLHSKKLFIDTLGKIFKSNRTAVMPIEVSQEELNAEAYFNIIGIHWNGLVISSLGNNKFRIELIDPAHSPANDTILDAAIIQGKTIVHTIAQLFHLINEAKIANNVNIDITWLKTEQQDGDLDCGAWTVDNLVNRAQGRELNNKTNMSGSDLRKQHMFDYNLYISELVIIKEMSVADVVKDQSLLSHKQPLAELKKEIDFLALEAPKTERGAALSSSSAFIHSGSSVPNIDKSPLPILPSLSMTGSIQQGWNCFDLAVGILDGATGRQIIVDYALGNADQVEFCRLLAPEIKHVAALTVSYMLIKEVDSDETKVRQSLALYELFKLFEAINPDDQYNRFLINRNIQQILEQKEYFHFPLGSLPELMRTPELKNLVLNYQQAHEAMKDAVATCNGALGRGEGKIFSLAELDDYFNEEQANIGNNQQAYEKYKLERDRLYAPHERALDEYCNSQTTYEQYVNGYYGQHNWFAFQRAFTGEVASTSMVDIVARMLARKIVIYQGDKVIYQTTNEAASTIEINYNGANHFTARHIPPASHQIPGAMIENKKAYATTLLEEQFDEDDEVTTPTTTSTRLEQSLQTSASVVMFSTTTQRSGTPSTTRQQTTTRSLQGAVKEVIYAPKLTNP